MKASIILTAIFLFLMLTSINISLFSNTWTDSPLIIESPGFRNGLWSFCNYTNDGKLTNCSALNNIPDQIKVVRAFTILALISGLVACICAAFCKDKPYITGIFTVIVIICSIISLSVYSTLNKFPWAPDITDNKQVLIGGRGAAYWTNISTIIFALIVTIISFIKFK